MSLSRERSKVAVQALEAGRLAQAISEARQALRIHEQNVEAMLVIAESFYMQGKYEIVQSVTSSVLQVDPEVLTAEEASKAQNLRGFAFIALGEPTAAMEAFRSAVLPALLSACSISMLAAASRATTHSVCPSSAAAGRGTTASRWSSPSCCGCPSPS